MYRSRVPCFGSSDQYSFLESFHALHESPGMVVRRTIHISSPTARCSRATLWRGMMSMSWHCCGSFCLNDEIIDIFAFVFFGIEYFDGCGAEVDGDCLFFFCLFSSCAWTVAASGADVYIYNFVAADVNVWAEYYNFPVFHIFSFNFSIVFIFNFYIFVSF